MSGAKALSGSLAGKYRMRTGDYRVQFHVAGEKVTVEKIGHRDGFNGDGIMVHQTIHLEGKTYVLLERKEFEKLKTLAKLDDLPPTPEADEDGNYPAVEFARVSLARKIIRDRVAVGLSQRELAAMAGIRVETLCRIESGKHTPSMASIGKIDRVLRKRRNQAKGK